MRILLVSTYELGHQPLSLAVPAAALVDAGYEVRCVDLSLDPFDAAAIDWPDRVAFSVPMHTAMRLALHAAGALRDRRSGVPLCFYGLYAPMSRELTLQAPGDAVIAGESLPGLLAWAAGADPGPPIQIGRPPATATAAATVGGPARAPARSLLPSLDRYARLATGDDLRLTASVATTSGCSHRCRHCPVPVVYDGRVRPVAEDAVLADVDQVVESGAGHLSFADPDFLNMPGLARRIIHAVHERHPGVSYDCTIKVEHLLRHRDLLPDLATTGCAFVVSAFESVDDRVLTVLDKGHTSADESLAVIALRDHGIEIRPSWLPFTPWTTLDGLVELMDFVIAHDLVANVDPVQYTVRLLVPEGSLLLGRPELTPHLGHYDSERLGWTWSHADPRVDGLQEELAALVEHAGDEDAGRTFARIDRAIRHAAGSGAAAVPPGSLSRGPEGPRARLTEPWFCCSEPTSAQLATFGR